MKGYLAAGEEVAVLAVWYPIELLRGAGGTLSLASVVLVTFLLAEAVARIGRR